MLTQSTLLNPKGELSNQQIIMHILSKMKKEVPMHTDQPDDYGTQKVCLKCGNAVVEFEPEVVKNEVHYWDFVKGNYFPGMKKPLMSVRHYKEEEVSGWKCPECGLLADDQVGQDNAYEHTNLDMDDLREVFKLGKGKKAYDHNRKLIEENWLKKNAILENYT